MFIITGGGTGIGRALALALASRKQRVLVVGRREQPLQEVVSDSSLITALSADVSSPDGRQKVVDHVHDIPSLQGLIHCAGVIKPIVPVCDINEVDWQSVISTNLDTTLFLTQALLNKLGNGRVLQMESKMADEPVKGLVAYCVSIAAVSMLIRCWKLEDPMMAITSVIPGVVNTDIPQAVADADNVDDTYRAALKELKQEKRLLPPETVALFLTWLLLDTEKSVYNSKTWDIYDDTHHDNWLVAPHVVVGQEIRAMRQKASR